MQDSLLVMGINARLLGYCGMLDLCVFKAGVEWEVAFSQHLYSCCHSIKKLFVEYLATGSREDTPQGSSAESPVCMYQSLI